MPASHIGSSGQVALLASTLAMLGPGAPAARVQDREPAWAFEVSAARVVVTCPLTVGGSFEAVTESLSGTLVADAAVPGAVDGSLAVALGTLDTGIGLRNRHLRRRYFEVDRGEEFARAVLTDIVLADAPIGSVEGRTTFTGALTLHGVTRTVAGEAGVERHPDGRRIEATFPVSLSAFAIPPPRYLGIGVRDQVQVRVEFIAAETRDPGLP